ncbi:MAG: M56 family metallopeptidase [Firmicutes bacterium]|nr:M56 family metallopeptidase [Bacillota bacterium]
MLRQIFSISLSMSAVIGLLIIVSPLLNKRYTAKWRYFVWLILAIRLVLPFNITLPKAPINIAPPSQSVIFKQHEELPMPVSYIEMGNNLTASADNTPIITVERLLGIVWGFGFIIFLLYRFAGYFIFRRKIKHWCKVADNGKPQVLICKKIAGPMLIGFFKPTILLPNIEYSNADLSAILAHETAHYKRKDLWYKLLLMFANAVHWFNPLVYAMAYFANKDMELSCDDAVVKNKDLQFRKAYSNTILNAMQSVTETPLSTCFKGGINAIKQRLSNILDMKTKKSGAIAFAVIIFITATASTLVSCNNLAISNLDEDTEPFDYEYEAHTDNDSTFDIAGSSLTMEMSTALTDNAPVSLEKAAYDAPTMLEIKYNHYHDEEYQGVTYTHLMERGTAKTITAAIRSLGQSQYNGGSVVDLKDKYYMSHYDFTIKDKEAEVVVTPDKNGNITLFFDGIANRLIDVSIQEKDNGETSYLNWSMEVANNKAYSFLGFSRSKEYIVTLGANSKYMWGENTGQFIIY